MKTPQKPERPIEIALTVGVGGLLLYIVYLATTDPTGGWGVFTGMLLVVFIGLPIALLLGVPLVVTKASDKSQRKFFPAKDASLGRKIVVYGQLIVLTVLSAFLVLMLVALFLS